jgi:hypothetical protein
MQSLTPESLVALTRPRSGPCLSLCQATHRHHPDNAQDPIRFANLVRTLAASLQDEPGERRERLLEPYRRLANDADFWNHTLDGLVVLSAPGESHVLRLQRTVPEFAVVAPSWHVKPLFRIQQTVERFQVLCLTRESVSLCEGNRDALDRLELADEVPATIEQALGDELTEPYQKVSRYGLGPAGGPGRDMRHGQGSKKDELDKDTERFFRVVDAAVLKHHSRPSDLPLILAALPEHQGHFHKLSRNPYLVEAGISTDPGSRDEDQLRRAAWQVMEPHLAGEVRRMVDEFNEQRAKGLASDVIDDALGAAVDGRIDKMLVDADCHIAGRLDIERRQVHRAEDFSDPAVGDVLDDMMELVIAQGGKVKVVPHARMPTQSGLAAVYRY